MSKPYSHYAPRTKQAVSVGEALDTLNPTGNNLADYGIYGGAGALGGAGIGALVEMLRGNEDKNYLKAMLLGGGIGGGLGVGAKALGDNYLKDNKAVIDAAMLDMQRGDNSAWYNMLRRRDAMGAETLYDYNRALELGAAPMNETDLGLQGLSDFGTFKNLIARAYGGGGQERGPLYGLGFDKDDA